MEASAEGGGVSFGGMDGRGTEELEARLSKGLGKGIAVGVSGSGMFEGVGGSRTTSFPLPFPAGEGGVWRRCAGRGIDGLRGVVGTSTARLVAEFAGPRVAGGGVRSG